MSNNGDEHTQNSPSGDQPYKSFSSEDEFTTFKSRTFSSGYNDMKSKTLANLSAALGEQVDTLDAAIDKIKSYKQKVSESISDPTATQEYKELQKTTNQWKQKADEAMKASEKVKRQYQTDSVISEVVGSLAKTHKLKINDKDIKSLYFSKHELEYNEGKEIVKQDGTPMIDDSGNYKSFKESYADFAKSYMEPLTGGSGGGSGDGGSVKPKFADFKAAKSNTALQSKLFNQAKEAGGWAEPDAPKMD